MELVVDVEVHLVKFTDTMSMEPPKDNYNFSYFVTLLLGIALLFPWNAFITVPVYWIDVFQPLTVNAEFYFSIIYNYPNFLFLILLLIWGNRFSVKSRIIFGFVLNCVALMVVPLLDNSTADPHIKVAITYLCVGLTGVGTGILFGTVVGYASQFPSIYVQAVMSGNGVGGVIVSAISIITTVSFPTTQAGVEQGTLIYFIAAAVIVILALVFFLLMDRTPFARFYLAKSGEKNAESGPDEKTPLRLVDAESVINEDAPVAPVNVSILHVLKKMWKNGLQVALIFFVTLAIFPGVISLIQPRSTDNWFTQNFMLMLVTIFQIFDFLGRTLPRWFTVFNARTIWIPTIIRFAFFPLFSLCVRPHVFEHEAWPCVFMAVFALSNGFLSSVGMMIGPVDCLPHEKDKGGILMTIFLNMGILGGVNFAMAMLHILQPGA